MLDTCFWIPGDVRSIQDLVSNIKNPISNMKEINAHDFEKEVLSGGKAIIDFYSTECPPCEALAPNFEDLSKIYGNKIKFIKIFRQGNRDLAEKLGIRSSPTLLFFDDGKEVAGRLTGGILRSQIIKNLDKMLE